ncbi:IucA/IucC family siderophore biosynthesis protein [Streptomyces sp. NBC_00878]|uniref:IucA/IucC family protein n=1 Tax=Streptomyces sp. NBC_00878 TaxID=2975854 RepID=UPI0022539096|nr:IucA/IucC family protein [Streptomyces sp. NBC_00878]MCX4904932.1 iron transporter [Streptomyces sp. NBC_00878]
MNATPAPDGRPHTHERGGRGTQTPLGPGAESVPRQKGGPRESERLRGATTDLLEHPDPHTAAQSAAIENLLRCWVREHDLAAPDGGTLRIPLPASGTALVVPVHYWSATGWHRLGPPHLSDAPDQAPPTDAVTLAALLGRETRTTGAPARPTASTDPEEPTGPNTSVATEAPTERTAFAITDGLGQPTASAMTDAPAQSSASAMTDAPAQPHASADDGDLVGRVADSVRQTVLFIADRRANPADGPDLFLSAEQALLLGHPLHPTPKSREGLSGAETRLYSPELRGSFPLHWMAVAPSLLTTDSAWTERGRLVPAEQLTPRLAGAGLRLPDGYAALPMHPWQIREVRHRPETAKLLDAGLLQDLGPHGSPWYPTSSVRTLYRSGAPAMLKLSLGLRITNSRRENLRKELHRGVEVHRLLRGGLAEQWQAVHPGFDIVRDPAWLAVNDLDGNPVPGLDVMIRHNPFTPTDDVSCIAGLVSPRVQAHSTGEQPPGQQHPEQSRTTARARLTEIVTRLACRTGRPRGAVAAEWFLRYLEHVVRPVLWLDSEAGIALEAHQQNTLLLLDQEGWPTGGRYRDNQGYYFRESRRAELNERLPGIGDHSDTFVSDEVTDERFAYYLAINNVFGLIGAFGSQRLADERLLLAAFRRFLTDVASGPSRLRTSLPAHLLDSPVLRCKANLLTRLHGLDELVGPVDTQSVYVTIANPLHS